MPLYHAFERVEDQTKVDRFADFLALSAQFLLTLSSQYQHPPLIRTDLAVINIGDRRRAYRRFPTK